MKEEWIVWYRLRGLGLLCLCSLVFFVGAYLANQRSVTASGAADGQQMPVTCVPTEEKKAVLTFDVLKDSDDVQTILAVLEKYGAKAVFFVTDGWAQAHPQELAAMAAAGDDIGSRGSGRRKADSLSGKELQRELRQSCEQIQKLCGAAVRLYRAPGGDFGNGLAAAARACGCLPVLWSVDSEDWKDYGVESIVRNVVENPCLENGAVIRLHSGAKYTAQALEAIVAGLQERGYALETLTSLIDFSSVFR